jgi:hypothetical protein
VIVTEVQLERVARAAIKILYDGLNTEIAAQNTAFDATANWWDEGTFWASIGQDARMITVETIADGNFYVGHVPSLIDAPLDRYPNVAAMAYNAAPMPSTDDHMDQFQLSLAVEIMCRGESTSDKPDQQADRIAAELVNARTQRTMNAVRNVLAASANRNLKGLVPKPGNTPTQTVTNVFVRHEEKGRGPRWLWQGARLEYHILTWVAYSAHAAP